MFANAIVKMASKLKYFPSPIQISYLNNFHLYIIFIFCTDHLFIKCYYFSLSLDSTQTCLLDIFLFFFYRSLFTEILYEHMTVQYSLINNSNKKVFYIVLCVVFSLEARRNQKKILMCLVSFFNILTKLTSLHLLP